jgi:hypothetical protein
LLVGNVGQMSIVIHFVKPFIDLSFYFIKGQKCLEHEGEDCLQAIESVCSSINMSILFCLKFLIKPSLY